MVGEQRHEYADSLEQTERDDQSEAKPTITIFKIYGHENEKRDNILKDRLNNNLWSSIVLWSEPGNKELPDNIDHETEQSNLSPEYLHDEQQENLQIDRCRSAGSVSEEVGNKTDPETEDNKEAELTHESAEN